MLTPRQALKSIQWENAQKKANNAVKILSKHGLSYSISDGIIGNHGNVSKRESHKIQMAGETMGKLQAGFYQNKSRNVSDTELRLSPAHYEPLELSDHEIVQEKSIQQNKSSMPLRAVTTFLSRTCYSPRLQAIPTRNVLGISVEEKQEWTNNTEALWRQDRLLKSWDESLQNDYDQLSDMAISHLLGIGENFAVIRNYSDDPTRSTNVSVELYHPMQIQSPRFAFGNMMFNITSSCGNTIIETSTKEYYDNLPKGHYIEKGIEYNIKHQEIAIFVAPTEFGQSYIKIPIHTKSGFKQVLHGFIQREPGQKRGIPDGAVAWHEWMNIRDLKRFEMQSAKLNSRISGTVTSDSNAMPNGNQGGLEDMGKNAGWPTTGNLPATESYTDPGYSVREVEGAGFVVQNFTPGYKYTEHNTSRPNLNIPLFIEKSLEYTHPATYGVSTTLVNQKFEGSYNASKGKIDISWTNGVSYYLKQFTSDWHRELYKIWLNGKVSTAEIIAPGWEIPKKRNAWSNMTIVTPAKPSLNPLQEAKAAEVNILGGLSNRELESNKITGTSFDENIDRLSYENPKLKEVNPVEEKIETKENINV
jgi:hypothetical protein